MTTWWHWHWHWAINTDWYQQYELPTHSRFRRCSRHILLWQGNTDKAIFILIETFPSPPKPTTMQEGWMYKASLASHSQSSPGRTVSNHSWVTDRPKTGKISRWSSKNFVRSLWLSLSRFNFLIWRHVTSCDFIRLHATSCNFMQFHAISCAEDTMRPCMTTTAMVVWDGTISLNSSHYQLLRLSHCP